MSGREKNAHFRAHYLFWPKIFFGPKQCKPGKTIKIVVSAEIAPNQKWHFFFAKGVFDMGEKAGFTNCVFEKLCFSENTIFIVFSAKHSFSKTKTVCWKNRKFMKNSGLFLNMAKWCFLGLLSEVLMLLWFVFGVFGIVPEVLNMFVVFPVLGFLWGGLFFFILGLEGLGVFVFFVFFVFVFVLFLFLFCLFCFCFVVGLFWCWFLVCFSFCFFFCFFCFFCFFSFFLFFVFWRV